MFLRKAVPFLVLILAVVLVACSGAAAGTEDAMMEAEQPAADASMEKNSNQEMMEEAGKDHQNTDQGEDGKMEPGSGMDDTSEMMDKDMGMMDSPAFFKAALVNATTGDTFSIRDYQGKVILVETMAIWCSNCLKQQKQVKALHELLGERDDFVSLGLDIDPNESLQDLQGYVERNGFDWLYAVAPVEVAREIAQLYGDQFLNPPSTPIFIIDRHGDVHPLPFGIKSAEQLKDAIDPFLSEGM